MAHDLQGPTHNNVSIVLIHGIGAIAAGSVIRAAETRICRLLGDECTVGTRVKRPRNDKVSAHIESLPLRWRSFGIELFEFNWTGVTGRMRLRSPLQATWRLMETVREVPSLSLYTRSHEERPSLAARSTAALVGWFQWLMVGLMAVLIVGSIIEAAAMPRVLTCDLDTYLLTNTLESCNPREANAGTTLKINALADVAMADDYGPALWRAGYRMSSGLGYVMFAAIMWFVAVLFIAVLPLLLLGLARVLFRSMSNRMLAVTLRTLVASAFLTVLVMFSGLMLHSFVTSAMAIGYVNWLVGLNVLDIPSVGAPFAISFLFLWLTLGVGNLLRDVVHYLSADPRATRGKEGMELGRQLTEFLTDLTQRPTPTHLVLVSHSLGTVILIDVLLRMMQKASNNQTVEVDLVTAGSPVRRLINRMLPNRLEAPAKLCALLRANRSLTVSRWFNVYRVFDYIGQSLTRSALPRELFRRAEEADPRTGIREHLLVPRLDRPSGSIRWRPIGHANYWGDDRFVQYLAAEVVKPVLLEQQPQET